MPMTADSLAMVSLIVITNTKAMITIMIYRRISIMARSPPISSPVNWMAWFRYLGRKSSR